MKVAKVFPFYSSVDKAHLRLAAAKAILRLSKQWDDKIPITTFHLTLKIPEASPHKSLCSYFIFLTSHIRQYETYSWHYHFEEVVYL